jgi:hypothetical protein
MDDVRNVFVIIVGQSVRGGDNYLEDIGVDGMIWVDLYPSGSRQRRAEGARVCMTVSF